jgi:hypothetical protein
VFPPDKNNKKDQGKNQKKRLEENELGRTEGNKTKITGCGP